MASAVNTASRQVRPILSLNQEEAKARVFNLYKAWYRQIPFILRDYDIPKSVNQCRKQLREEFEKHSNVQDIRVIDHLIIKGQMELKEVAEVWQHKGLLMKYFKDDVQKKPTDFMSKFLSGQD